MSPQQRTVRILALPDDWHELQAEGLKRIQSLASLVRPELPRVDPLDPRPSHVHWWFEDDMGGSLLQWTAEVDEDGVRYGFSFGAPQHAEDVPEIWTMDTWVNRLPPTPSAVQRAASAGTAIGVLGAGIGTGFGLALGLASSMGGSATLVGIFGGLAVTLILAVAIAFLRARMLAGKELSPVPEASVEEWRSRVWEALDQVDSIQVLAD